MVLLPILAKMTCYHQWNLFGISLLGTMCLNKITILLIELKTVCELLPSTLSIRITKKYLKTKGNLQVIKELRKDAAIPKPDKGNGVLVIDTTDYYESLDKLFSDTTKFKRLDADPTNTRLSTLQSYLQKLNNRNRISEEVVHQKIRPKNGKIPRAHGSPKVHESFVRVPSFRLIIDTIGSTHYNVTKYITKLLNPLTQNEYSLKETFDRKVSAESIKKIPKELIRNED